MRRVLYLWVPHLHTAVERLLAPGLAGQPVVVASGSFARGVVVDASPEAEALGVGAGQSWRHARRHGAGAIFIAYERMRFQPFTERIGGLLHEMTPCVEMLPGSEEEFFADLGAGTLEEGELLARGAVEAVRDALGLEARVGLATGKLVARTACRDSGGQAFRRSGVQADPVDHIITSSHHHIITPSVPPGTERRFLRPLSLEYLWDMQPEHRRRLGPLGLRTFGQLAAVPPRMLIEQFGPVGRWYRLLAAGIDARRVKPWAPHPTISSRLIVEEEPADLPLLEGYLELLARRLSDTLIATGQYARVISVMLEVAVGCRLSAVGEDSPNTDSRQPTADSPSIAHPFASRHLKAPTNLPEPIRRAGHELLVGLLKQGSGVQAFRRSGSCSRSSFADPERLNARTPERLTLIAGGLEARGLIQLSLFGDPERGPLLRAAIARIQDRFGEAAIVPAASVVSGQRLVVRKDGSKAGRSPTTNHQLLTTNHCDGAPD
jgi:DNA polymerase IV